MKSRDHVLAQGAAAALAVAARRGPAAFEAALARLTTHQRARVGDGYIKQLRRETSRKVGDSGEGP